MAIGGTGWVKDDMFAAATYPAAPHTRHFPKNKGAGITDLAHLCFTVGESSSHPHDVYNFHDTVLDVRGYILSKHDRAEISELVT